MVLLTGTSPASGIGVRPHTTAPSYTRLCGWNLPASIRPVHSPLPLSSPACPNVQQPYPPSQPSHRVRTHATATKGKVAFSTDSAVGEYLEDWEYDEEADNPAFYATQRMLQWGAICEHVSSFASTSVGKREVLKMAVPLEIGATQLLLAQTRAAITLEYDFSTTLDFGGIETTLAERALLLASKGAGCNAAQLKAAVSLANGAERLKRLVQAAARDNDSRGRDSVLAPLLEAVADIQPQAGLARAVALAIDNDGSVMDSASTKLAVCRANVKKITSRLTAMLKGYGGEVSEKGGRLCVVQTAGDKMINGVILGSAPGGSMVYIEPPIAVQQNNDLVAARAIAMEAEEEVLFELSGKLMGVLHDMMIAFKAVVWLDVLASRARYGNWIKGTLPEIVPWETVFRARGSGARKSRNVESYDQMDNDPDAKYALRLRSLKHPLLYANYLREKHELELELRAAGADVEDEDEAERRKMKRKGTSRSHLSNRKQDLGTTSSGSDSDTEGEALLQLKERYKACRPPRPVDIVIRPETSVVVVTGPNTGGKTATMKALGLAVMMAKAGLPIPADAPVKLPCFSSVLADIGDEQSLTANLSTFSGHLYRIQALRAEADGKSLVLLDELGTGTDPTEGAALGVALLKKMVEGGLGGGALTMATTHHSIMTGLKFEDDRFENASVEFDEEALAPTYKLLWGIPGKSNALNIATRLGLDADVIEAARGRLDTSVSNTNDAIEELERLRDILNDKESMSQYLKEDIESLRRSVRGLKSEVEVFQGQLSQARSSALFEMWLEHRIKFKKAKDIRKSWRRGTLPFGRRLADFTFPEPAASDASTVASALGMDPRLFQVEQVTEAQGDMGTLSLEDAEKALKKEKKKKKKKKK